MKIIDLLNKIANGEKIKAMHKLFSLEYYNLSEFHISYDKSINDFTLGDLIRILNDEVEIIEEKKIPEKICTNRIINTKDILEFEMIQNKINAEYTYAINEIIDYLESKGE